MTIEPHILAVFTPPPPPGWMDSLTNGRLPFNWFDLAVLLLLAVGFARGRKHGMSVEMMNLMQWLAMIFGAAFAYESAGKFMASVSVFSLLFCNVTAYIVSAIGIKLFFSLLKRAVGGKLVGSNLFGPAEYYLGMAAGMARFACVVIFLMAPLNARLVTSAEIKAATAYNKKYYGGDMYSGNFFPDLRTIQQQVFEKSFLGPKIHDQLTFLLIKPTVAESREIKRKEADLPQ